jgi:hypothetical protein
MADKEKYLASVWLERPDGENLYMYDLKEGQELLLGKSNFSRGLEAIVKDNLTLSFCTVAHIYPGDKLVIRAKGEMTK